MSFYVLIWHTEFLKELVILTHLLFLIEKFRLATRRLLKAVGQSKANIIIASSVFILMISLAVIVLAIPNVSMVLATALAVVAYITAMLSVSIIFSVILDDELGFGSIIMILAVILAATVFSSFSVFSK
jgi:hypothetical protein